GGFSTSLCRFRELCIAIILSNIFPIYPTSSFNVTYDVWSLKIRKIKNFIKFYLLQAFVIYKT
ncbi:hypothetical protein X975_10695, partial [Stegodyphus mimosarum]